MVGEILRKRREELGRDLREIADTLKIKYDYLRAIEEGDKKMLPAEVYVRGYLQEYAKVLDIDPETIIHEYDQQQAPPRPEQDIIQEQMTPQRKRLKIGYFIIPLLIAVVIIVIASIQSKPTRNPEAPVSAKDAGNTMSASREIPPDIENNAPAANSSPQTKGGHETAEEVGKAVQGAGPASGLSQQNLEIIASDTTWILVTADKANPKEMLLQPGESVTLHAKDRFSLKIGNAGGVKLVFNGREIGNLGEKGQVINMELPNT